MSTPTVQPNPYARFNVNPDFAWWEKFEYAASWMLAGAYIVAVVAAMIFTGITAPIYLPVTSVAAYGFLKPVETLFDTLRAWAASNGEYAAIEAGVQQKLNQLDDGVEPALRTVLARQRYWAAKDEEFDLKAQSRREVDLVKLKLYEKAVDARIQAVAYKALYLKVTKPEAELPIHYCQDTPCLENQVFELGLYNLIHSCSSHYWYVTLPDAKKTRLTFKELRVLSGEALYERAFPSPGLSLQ